MSSIYTDLVQQSGLAASHALVISAAGQRDRVLDVGCATGYLGAALIERGSRVWGVERHEADAEVARRNYEAVVVGDVEDPALLPGLPDAFDAILFADVLEHLRDPVAVLSRARGTLAADGVIVVSLPNIAHWTARRAVVRGTFPYADFGLFDRTHLRFFTRASAHQLARDAGLAVAEERFAPALLPFEYGLAHLGFDEAAFDRVAAPIRKRLIHRFPELFALQFVLTLRTPAATR